MRLQSISTRFKDIKQVSGTSKYAGIQSVYVDINLPTKLVICKRRLAKYASEVRKIYDHQNIFIIYCGNFEAFVPVVNVDTQIINVLEQTLKTCDELACSTENISKEAQQMIVENYLLDSCMGIKFIEDLENIHKNCKEA